MTALFGAVADTYADARPGYSASLADDIRRYHGKQPQTVAEIGAGTGKGTEVLRRLGGKLICVEPDAKMAAKLPAVAEVFHGTFEQWVPPEGGVDILACALAWHWVDAGTRVRRALAALAPGGTLAIIGNRYSIVDPAQRAALDETFEPFDESRPVERRPQFWFYREIADSGLFQNVECHVSHRNIPLTTANYLALNRTFSPFLLRPEDEQKALLAALESTLDKLGGKLIQDLRTTLVLATPRVP